MHGASFLNGLLNANIFVKEILVSHIRLAERSGKFARRLDMESLKLNVEVLRSVEESVIISWSTRPNISPYMNIIILIIMLSTPLAEILEPLLNKKLIKENLSMMASRQCCKH